MKQRQSLSSCALTRVSRASFLAVAAALFGVFTVDAQAGIVLSENFDDGAAASRWTTVASSANPLATSAVYDFDYSGVLDFNGNPIGVPQAGQTTHTGLKLAANIDPAAAAVAGINAYANGLNLTTSAVMTFDMYAKFGDAGGSTIYGTYGFYHSTQSGTWNSLGTTATSGIWFTNSSDNGTSLAMRALEAATQDNTASRYLDGTQNPGSAAGVTYQALFPDLDGAGGNSLAGYVLNRWVNVRLSRDMATGEVKWEMKNPGDASYTQIYSVVDGTQTQMSGTVTLGMTDPFSSLSGPNTYFLYDNVVVTAIPEPATLCLLGMSVLALCAPRRR